MFLVVIDCPTCRHAIRIVDLRAGQFTPRCPRCRNLFELRIPEEAGAAPEVSTIDSSPHEPEPSTPKSVATAEEGPVPTTEPSGAPTATGHARRLPTWFPRGLPGFLGRFLPIKLLGHGPRGRTFLAKTLGIGEDVVLKVVAPDRARDAIFLAWHAREAFASSQLDHPNLVRIRELGHAGKRHYVAMEHLPGETLAERSIRSREPLFSPADAAAIALHAARGLRFAHEQGLLHRDLKPANIRVDQLGLVEVDDLGLEMTPSLAAALQAREVARRPEKMTGRGSGQRTLDTRPRVVPVLAAAGTPAYMPPEQAREPHACDARSDVYALGATLFHLVTGRPPYAGETAVALIAAHQESPLTPPEELVPGLPRALGEILQTMLGKHPAERYPSMGVVVEVLEGFLGLDRERTASARSELEAVITQAARNSANAPARMLGARVLAIASAIWLVFSLLLIALGLWRVSQGLLAFGLLTAALLLLVGGVGRRTPLKAGLREYVAGCRPGSLLFGLVALATLFVVLLTFGLLGPWLCLTANSGGIVAAFELLVNRPYRAERARSSGEVGRVVHNLRRAGHDEVMIRSVITQCSGALRDDLLAVILGERGLSLLGEASKPTGAEGGLRGNLPGKTALLCWLVALLEKQRDRRHRRLLEQTEEGRLESEGENLVTARRRARRTAAAMVAVAREWRDDRRFGLTEAPPVEGRTLVDRLRFAIEDPEAVLEAHERNSPSILERIGKSAGRLVSRKMRLVLAGCLIGVLAAWLHESKILTGDQVRAWTIDLSATVRRAIELRDPAVLLTARWNPGVDAHRLNEPVAPEWLPVSMRGDRTGADLGAAGLILLCSLISRRPITGLCSMVGAALILFAPTSLGSLPWPAAGWDLHGRARLVGTALFLLGFLFPRRRSHA